MFARTGEPIDSLASSTVVQASPVWPQCGNIRLRTCRFWPGSACTSAASEVDDHMQTHVQATALTRSNVRIATASRLSEPRGNGSEEVDLIRPSRGARHQRRFVARGGARRFLRPGGPVGTPVSPGKEGRCRRHSVAYSRDQARDLTRSGNGEYVERSESEETGRRAAAPSPGPGAAMRVVNRCWHKGSGLRAAAVVMAQKGVTGEVLA